MATHEKILHSDLEWYTGQSLTPTKTIEENVQVNFFIPGTQFFFLKSKYCKATFAFRESGPKQLLQSLPYRWKKYRGNKHCNKNIALFYS